MTQSKTLKQYKAVVPSNIAFLKYWGKSDEQHQWPANDSLSMTLSDLHTETFASIIDGQDHQVFLNEEEISRSHKMGAKISSHLDYIKEFLSSDDFFKISSRNSFPTGCGIASSASGLGALSIAVSAAILKAESMSELEKARP